MNPEGPIDVSAWRVVAAAREAGRVVAQVETPEGVLQLASSSTPAEVRAAASSLSPMGRFLAAAILEAAAGVSEDSLLDAVKPAKERRRLHRENRKRRIMEAGSAAAYDLTKQALEIGEEIRLDEDSGEPTKGAP